MKTSDNFRNQHFVCWRQPENFYKNIIMWQAALLFLPRAKKKSWTILNQCLKEWNIYLRILGKNCQNQNFDFFNFLPRHFWLPRLITSQIIMLLDSLLYPKSSQSSLRPTIFILAGWIDSVGSFSAARNNVEQGESQ